MTTENVDVITIRIHLNELKTQFDNAMREGEEFAALKKMYMEIKELECYLNVLEWQADKERTRNRYYDKWYNSHIKQPAPLL
jgi:hypothetical protein